VAARHQDEGMSMLTKYLYGALAAAVLSVSIGLATSKLPALTPLPAALGLLVVAGRWRRWEWSASVGMIGHVALASFGVLTNASPIWMLLGAIAALGMWDVDHFLLRVEGVKRIGEESRFCYAHIRRLGLVLGLGLALSLIALSLRVQLDLGWAMALGLLAVIGLAQALQFLRRESD
jgi:hypothetical protein